LGKSKRFLKVGVGAIVGVGIGVALGFGARVGARALCLLASRRSKTTALFLIESVNSRHKKTQNKNKNKQNLLYFIS